MARTANITEKISHPSHISQDRDMAGTLPLHRCVSCARYSAVDRYCEHYVRRLPEPAQECHCVHYRPRSIS